jgi:hypothetical protein
VTLKILIGRFSRNFFSGTAEGIENNSLRLIYFLFLVFQQYFSYIMATSFSCGGSQSTRTTTDHREATGKLYH